MKTTAFAPALVPLAAAAALNLAVIDDNRAVQLDGLLKLPVTTVPVPKEELARRQNPVTATSRLNAFYYTVPISVGTPGQELPINIDTGSAQLWVNPVCKTAFHPSLCDGFSRYDSGKSSSVVDLGQSQRLGYGSGYADVKLIQETVTIGSASIVNQTMGDATDTDHMDTGLLGLGPELKGFDTQERPLVLDSLKNQGLIKSRAFSVDLRSTAAARGNFIFGGVDTKKFTGTLQRLPIIDASAAPDKSARYWVNMDAVHVTAGGKTVAITTDKQPVVVDTGSTVSSLPAKIADAVASHFTNATKDEQSGNYIVPCDTRQKEGSVTLTFGDAEITTPYADFIYQFSGQDLCILGIGSNEGSTYILGDTFFHNAYLVYDQDDLSVSIAASKDCGTNLQAIGPDPVGALQGEC